MSRKDFIDEIGGVICDECISRGYKFPSMIIAQACLESNYGLSSLARDYHNYFGMKCGSSWGGKSVNLATKEEYNGKLENTRDNFRVYKDMHAGVVGYFAFIKYARYANLKYAKTAYEYAEMIAVDGWATDSTYANKLINIYTLYGLDFFDRIVAGDVKPEPAETLDDVVAAVIRGDYGNGEERREKLTAAGWDYTTVQNAVNAKLNNDMTPVYDVDEIARQVIRGEWGNGQTRREKLTAAGYDYSTIQNRVNEMLRG